LSHIDSLQSSPKLINPDFSDNIKNDLRKSAGFNERTRMKTSHSLKSAITFKSQPNQEDLQIPPRFNRKYRASFNAPVPITRSNTNHESSRCSDRFQSPFSNTQYPLKKVYTEILSDDCSSERDRSFSNCNIDILEHRNLDRPNHDLSPQHRNLDRPNHDLSPQHRNLDHPNQNATPSRRRLRPLSQQLVKRSHTTMLRQRLRTDQDIKTNIEENTETKRSLTISDLSREEQDENELLSELLDVECPFKNQISENRKNDYKKLSYSDILEEEERNSPKNLQKQPHHSPILSLEKSVDETKGIKDFKRKSLKNRKLSNNLKAKKEMMVEANRIYKAQTNNEEKFIKEIEDIAFKKD